MAAVSVVFRNWLIILVSLTAGLAVASAIGNATSPEIGGLLRSSILLLAAGIGIVDAIKRMAGQTGVLGRGRGAGRMVAVVQLIASLVLAATLLIA